MCECPEGWEGEDCSEDVDSCVGEERCFNGGVCVDLVHIVIVIVIVIVLERKDASTEASALIWLDF